MVDLELLNKEVEASGLKASALSERSEIPPRTLNRRLKGEGDFTANEIMGMCKALKLTQNQKNMIFFAEKCEP